MSEALITKYRPKTFDDVVGHASVVKSLRAALKKGTSRMFLFSGPPGLGKTTLARIVAREVGCPGPPNLIEVDGATATGIDDMREVASSLLWKPLGEVPAKAIIVDEVQGVSKSAISSLLKITEEPPPWAYWFFCTTEPTKVGEAMRSRCAHYALKPVSFSELAELLDRVAEAEDFRVDESIIDLCAEEARGSPRQALSNLGVCSEARSLNEAAELLRTAGESSQAVELARALVQRKGWEAVQKILTGLNETSPESVRHVVRAYVSKVVLGAKRVDDAGRGIEILDAFSEPFHPSDGVAPLIVACGRVVFRE